MSNKTYDILKFWALMVLPGLATLYSTLAGIWGLPRGMEVVGTITAIDVFLGLLLGLSTSKYNSGAAGSADGAFLLNTSNPDKDILTLRVDRDLEDLMNKKVVTLKVQNTNE